MRVIPFLFLSLPLGLATGCSDQSRPVAADTAVPQGTWGSDQASLTITEGGAALQVMASGGCVGSFGQITGSIPVGEFSLPGTYTQLMGAYPGHIDYAAQYVGHWDGNQLTLKLTVATLPQSIGPFHLNSSVKPTWHQCLYP